MPLPRRQEAEDETFDSAGLAKAALVTHEEVMEWAMGSRDAVICSVSHAWETREHPDPCCFQLSRLVDCISLYDAAYFSEIWVFFDYTSLYQFKRNAREQHCYDLAMQNVQVMYAHECSMTLRIVGLTPDDVWKEVFGDPDHKVQVYHQPSDAIVALPLQALLQNRSARYSDRGWCKAETEWSSTRNMVTQNQRIDGGAEQSGDVESPGKVPMVPDVFAQQMAQAVFTHRDDALMVVELQRKVFQEKVMASRELVLENLSHGDMEELVNSLPHFKDNRF